VAASGEGVSRRELLLAVAGVALGGSAACSKKKSFACTGTVGLNIDEVKTRSTLAYVDATPEPGKTCASCQHFVPSPDDGRCGSCKIMKGPIHPDGYCKSFVVKA
jgi:hypothetical protein